MSDYLDANNEELLKDFFSEAEQQVETLESNILVIENDPSNHDAIDEIFRAAHTLKGGSATVEMTELATFCHEVEDLLDALRSGSVSVSEPIVDVLLSAIDTIKAMLEARSSGTVYDADTDPIVKKIMSFIPEKGEKKKSAPVKLPAGMLGAASVAKSEPQMVPAAAGADTGMPPVPPISAEELSELNDAVQDGQKLWTVNVTFDESNPMNSVGGWMAMAQCCSSGFMPQAVA